MNDLDIYVTKTHSGTLSKDGYNYFYEYISNANRFVSLSIPIRKERYSHRELFPIFEMNLPEGYLYEIFKNLLQKETKNIKEVMSKL